jgi:isoleucyl-tRNA synthetase
MEEIIREELNIKEVIYRENEEELVQYKAQPNYRKLGKILGKSMKEAAEKIGSLGTAEIQSIMDGATISLDVGSRVLDLTEEDLNITREEKENLKVLNEGSLTVAMDSELTEELVQEGTVRDMVRFIQNLRKEKGLEVTDRISLSLYGTESLKSAVEKYEEHLVSETLTVSWKWMKEKDAVEAICGEESCFISLSRRASV